MGTFKIDNKELIGFPETPPLKLAIEVNINGQSIIFMETVNYRINDPVRGEVITPFYNLPELGINFDKAVHLYANDAPQNVRLEVTNYGTSFSGEIELCFPEGWKIDQAKQRIQLEQRGSAQFLNFNVQPTNKLKADSWGPLSTKTEKQKCFFCSTYFL